MSSPVVDIFFKVKADVRYGEEIRVSGNVPSLGCDDISRAVQLVTSPSDYPWWTTTTALRLPEDLRLVKYRYCIFSGGVFQRFECSGEVFRAVNVGATDSVVKFTSDTFDDPSVSAEVANDTPPTRLSNVEATTLRSKQYSERRSSYDISFNDSVIVVSYFLPVIIKKVNNKWSASWNREDLLSFQTNLRVTWVGSVRYNGVLSTEDEENITAALQELNCQPIFIDDRTHTQFYEEYCKKNLWPVLHHNADEYGPLALGEGAVQANQCEQDTWFTYTTVNRMFRAKIVEVYHVGDLVWIHGFHLLLLPSNLRRVLPLAKIGLFMHTPFPSSEIWRTLSRREDLLRGMLGADQIGFHLYEYSRHFLTTCRRLLGAHFDMNAAGVMAVTVDGRDVAITSIHVGVDRSVIEKTMETESFLREVLTWRQKFANKTVVSSIDRLERIRGIPLRLLTIEQFARNNTHWVGKVVFVIIGITALEMSSDYEETLLDVKVLLRRIESEYPGLVYFEERSEMKLEQRLPLFVMSEVFLATAPRDGLNRMPMEYTLARALGAKYKQTSVTNKNVRDNNEGLIIISEFISSARVMRGALTVNPWCMDEVETALLRVLTMSPDEKAARMRRNLEFSMRLTTVSWAANVLQDLKAVEKSTDHTSYSAVGFGISYRVMGVKSGFQTLDIALVNKDYRNSHHRLILLDWGGTLVDEHDVNDSLQRYAVATGHASRAGPSDDMKSLLAALCADRRNTIFVVSGKDVHAVSEHFSQVKGLGMAAEHGCYYVWPWDIVPRKNKWNSMIALGDTGWKDAARNVMDIYVQRTHGTYIEEKGNAIIWQFRDADPEFGYLQSKELEEHLNDVTWAYDVEILRGGGVSDGYIEVRPAGVSKGLFLLHALSIMKARHADADFVMAIGDDISDEPMFEHIDRMMNSSDTKNCAYYSVAVGKKPTAAHAYVNDPEAVMELLTGFLKLTKRDRKFHSAVDLPSQASLKSSADSPVAEHSPLSSRSPPKPGMIGLSVRPSSTNNLRGVASEGNLVAASPVNRSNLAALADAHSSKQSAGIAAESRDKKRSLGSRGKLSLNDYMGSIVSHEEEGIFF